MRVTERNVLLAIPGGRELFNWFGYAPSFHDGYLLDLGFFSDGSARLLLHAWNTTHELYKHSGKKYMVLDKHVVVNIESNGISHLKLNDSSFPGKPLPAIIDALVIDVVSGGYEISWSANYGLEGAFRAKNLCISLQPGQPGAEA